MKLAVASTALMLTVVACSSSGSGTKGSGSGSGATTPGGSSFATSSTGSSTPANEGALSRIVLQAGDAPSGWTVEAPEQSDRAEDAKLVDCIDPGGNLLDNRLDEYPGPGFSLSSSHIGSSASSWRSGEDVSKSFVLLGNGRSADCFEQLLKQQLLSSLPAGSTVDEVTFTIGPRPASLNRPEVGAVGEGKATVTSNGQQVTLYLNIAFLGRGTHTAQVQWVSVGQRLDSALTDGLVLKVAERLRAA